MLYKLKNNLEMISNERKKETQIYPQSYGDTNNEVIKTDTSWIIIFLMELLIWQKYQEHYIHAKMYENAHNSN